MAKKSIKKNFFLNSAYQVLQVLTPIITTPYLARVLGPEQSGVFAYTQSVAGYFALFGLMGIAAYGVRIIAVCGNDRKKRSYEFCNAYASQLFTGVIASLAYLFYALIWHEGGIFIVMLWMPYLIYTFLDVSWLMFGVEEFKIPTIRSIIVKLFSIAAIFVFVHSANDLWIYVLLVSLSYLLNALIVWPFVGNYIDFVLPKKKEIKRHLKANAILFLPVIAVSVYTTLDKIMLGVMSTSSEVAFFNYSERIARLPLSVVTALGTVMMPRMALLLSSGRREESLSLLESSVWIMLATAFALAFGIAAVSPEFVPVFFGPGYEPCAILMPLLAIIIPVITVTNVLGKQYLLPMECDKQYTVSLIAGAAVNVIVNLATIPSFGALGAAIGTVAAETSILVIQIFATRKELPLATYARGAVPFVFIGLAMFICDRFVAGVLVGAGFTDLLTLLLEFVFSAVLYIIAAIAWSLFSENEQFKKIFMKNRRNITHG